MILRDGTISEGWVGGSCARAAVLQTARDVLRQQGLG
ncbi:MAG TPA: XdhC family protein [Xanthobacteraceae bacterium]